MKEQWKPVKGFEGKYIVSNFGNVMSIPRTYTNKLGREYTVDGFTLVKHDDTNGYDKVWLGDSVMKSVHRIVAEVFVPNPYRYSEVNHKDGNKKNNCATNLEWVTHICMEIDKRRKERRGKCKMSMTLEEAIKLLKQYQGYEPMFQDGETLKHAFDLTDETVDTLLTALRPVSREQVEKVFPGCPYCDMAKANDNIYNKALWVKEAETSKWTLAGKSLQYCPICGRPLTDEAVQMVMERMEALYETT